MEGVGMAIVCVCCAARLCVTALRELKGRGWFVQWSGEMNVYRRALSLTGPPRVLSWADGPTIRGPIRGHHSISTPKVSKSQPSSAEVIHLSAFSLFSTA